MVDVRNVNLRKLISLIRPRVYGVPVPKEKRITPWPFRIGDAVEVCNGPENKKRGIIIYMYPKSNKVILSGCNNQILDNSTPFGFDKKDEREQYVEHAISAYDVRLLDPTNNKPTRVYFKHGLRYSAETHKSIDFPIDYETKTTKSQPPSSSCTNPEHATNISWIPSLKFSPFPVSFENEIYRLSRKSAQHYIPNMKYDDVVYYKK